MGFLCESHGFFFMGIPLEFSIRVSDDCWKKERWKWAFFLQAKVCCHNCLSSRKESNLTTLMKWVCLFNAYNLFVHIFLAYLEISILQMCFNPKTMDFCRERELCSTIPETAFFFAFPIYQLILSQICLWGDDTWSVLVWLFKCFCIRAFFRSTK